MGEKAIKGSVYTRLRRHAAVQVPNGVGENVIVTQTRVRIPLGHQSDFVGRRRGLLTKIAIMKRKAKSALDPRALLAMVGTGRTTRDCRKNQMIFTQGDRADVVF